MTTFQVDAVFSDVKVLAPIARVVIDTPLDMAFDHRCGQPVLSGQLAIVPFGNRRATGLVVEAAATTDVP